MSSLTKQTSRHSRKNLVKVGGSWFLSAGRVSPSQDQALATDFPTAVYRNGMATSPSFQPRLHPETFVLSLASATPTSRPCSMTASAEAAGWAASYDW